MFALFWLGAPVACTATADVKVIIEVKNRGVLEAKGVYNLQFLRYFEATATIDGVHSLFGALTDGEKWFLCKFTLGAKRHKLDFAEVRV